ncbi:hypothetical protein OUZ56_004890 [Daphnia magna]|uniref:Uncharacterized protein n=1 Tax=Daphnia magna TaxID=35525 RepID=A0ABQ9YR68_9CRUS|nr:hypothetical protein OUZ56_004890 [Daphnia magna]
MEILRLLEANNMMWAYDHLNFGVHNPVGHSIRSSDIIMPVMVSQTYRKISRHELGVTLNEFVSLDNVLHPTDGKTNPAGLL